jgi:predicted nucleic acid-binding Zn ribbon protein
MQSIQSFATVVLSDIVRRGPSSPARTAFAWRLAVGPALANATTVELVGNVLMVHASDSRWADEIRRSRQLVLGRLQQLLGNETIAALRFARATSSPSRAKERDHRKR